MALFANTSEVALALSIRIRVINIQCQFREFLHMLLMVDKFRPSKSAPLFVDLTLIPIHVEHFFAFLFPFPGKIESVNIARSDPLFQFLKKFWVQWATSDKQKRLWDNPKPLCILLRY